MKEVLLKNWKTTLFSVVTLVLFALVQFGVLTPEQSEAINEGTNQVVGMFEGGATVATVSGILLVLGNVLLMFSKDGDKK